MAELVLERDRLRRELGRGATGVVYEAVDASSSATVALKKIQVPAAEDIYRLKQEFRTLAALEHRNLVRLGELACADEQWFFTMELVEGTNFLDYVRPGGGADSEQVSLVRTLVEDPIDT